MKVAIIGAGIAGLACAHELEKYGVRPVIYESNSHIGDQYSHVSAFLEILNRPVRDVIAYFKEDFGIEIRPLTTLNCLKHYSPNKCTEIRGNMGYLMKRGRDGDAMHNQIFRQLKHTEIVFGETGDYETLSNKYDFVLIANGTYAFTNELGCWQNLMKTYIRGAVVLGDFDPNTLIMWLNKNYCKNGYAYAAPFDRNKASIVLIVNDVDVKEIDDYWELFLDTENIRCKIVEEFKLEHRSGFVYPYRLGGIFFAGNAAGGIDPFLGFGQLSAVTMGVMAARSMVNGNDYEALIGNIIRCNIRKYEFRKAINRASNKDYDLIISAIGLPGIKQLLYKSRIDIIKHGSSIIRLLSGNRTGREWR